MPRFTFLILHTRITVIKSALVFCVTLVMGSHAWAQADESNKAQSDMRLAIQHIQNQKYELARTYLNAVVISPRIGNTQRSRGYYFRGFSYYSQKMYVSAAQDYARSLEFDPANKTTLSAISHLYSLGLGVKKNLVQAFDLALKAARAGHQASQYRVGRAYLLGIGTQAHLKKARYWLETSAGDDYAPAMVQLAASYRIPASPEPDAPMAESLYQKARQLGSSDALVGLAYMHLNGELVIDDGEKADLVLAAEYFRQAAGAGSPAGQAGLGYMYLSGQGLKKDLKLASTWFERSAEAGNAFAQLQLAELMLKSPTLENVKSALDWLQKAAATGAISAQNSLAWLLATSKYDEVRNGKKALGLANAIVNKNTRASFLDTLAAALAEVGQFDQAITAQKRAITLLDNPELSKSGKYDQRLSAYKNKKAWRE